MSDVYVDFEKSGRVFIEKCRIEIKPNRSDYKTQFLIKFEADLGISKLTRHLILNNRYTDHFIKLYNDA